MANEFVHANVGAALSQAEYESITGHVLNNQATGDMIYASNATQLRRLGIGSNNQILSVSSGIPTWSSFNTSEWVKVSAGTLGAVGDLTFSGLSGYQRYRMSVWLKKLDSSVGSPYFRFNGISTSSYQSGYMVNNGTSATGTNLSGTSILFTSLFTSGFQIGLLTANIQLFESSSGTLRNIVVQTQYGDYNYTVSVGTGSLNSPQSSISSIYLNFGVTLTDGMYLLEGSNSTS